MYQFLAHYAWYILFLYGIGMTSAFYYVPAVRNNKLVHLIHFVLFFMLAYFMWVGELGAVSSQGTPVPMGFLFGFIKSAIALFCSGYVFVCIVRFYVETWSTMLMGDHRLRVPKTYDRAEAAEKAMDYELAASLYKSDLQDDPADGEAYRRLAEIYVKMSDFHAALTNFQNALNCTLERDRRCAVLMRLADLYAGYLGDIDAAADQLQTILHQYPGSKHAGYAHARLEALDAKRKRERGEAPQQTPPAAGGAST